MKALTTAFSLAALLAALVVLPGCGGGDEAVPPAPAGDVAAPAGDDMMPGAPGEGGAMAGPAAEVETDEVEVIAPAEEPATP